ncbi:unnamed protein product [Clonostachys solani]|uniref:Uncharacterized protein n=1 Tax=Clonostachys solani TaxID=160281 RepID=A0A9N9YX23_9HYPO|nr:unnamed protein product [Clonostachys solani]
MVFSFDFVFHQQKFNLNARSGPLTDKSERRDENDSPDLLSQLSTRIDRNDITSHRDAPRFIPNQMAVEAHECSLRLPFRPTTHLNTESIPFTHRFSQFLQLRLSP